MRILIALLLLLSTFVADAQPLLRSWLSTNSSTGTFLEGQVPIWNATMLSWTNGTGGGGGGSLQTNANQFAPNATLTIKSGARNTNALFYPDAASVNGLAGKVIGNNGTSTNDWEWQLYNGTIYAAMCQYGLRFNTNLVTGGPYILLRDAAGNQGAIQIDSITGAVDPFSAGGTNNGSVAIGPNASIRVSDTVNANKLIVTNSIKPLNIAASRAVVTDAQGVLTNASGTADGTHYLDGTGAYSTPAGSGSGFAALSVQTNDVLVGLQTNINFTTTSNLLRYATNNAASNKIDLVLDTAQPINTNASPVFQKITARGGTVGSVLITMNTGQTAPLFTIADTNGAVQTSVDTNFVLSSKFIKPSSASVSLAAVIGPDGLITNATGTPNGTKFLRDDNTYAVPAGGGGTPGGTFPMMQFNDTSGVFAGTTNITFNSTNKTLVFKATTSSTNFIEITGPNASTAIDSNGGFHVGSLLPVGGSNIVAEGSITAKGGGTNIFGPTSFTNTVTITNGGFLGVGTNAPSMPLDVQGNGSVSGSLTVGGTGIAGMTVSTIGGLPTLKAGAGSVLVIQNSDSTHYTTIRNSLAANIIRFGELGMMFNNAGPAGPAFAQTNGDLILFGGDFLFGGGDTNRFLLHGGLVVGPPGTAGTLTNTLYISATLNFPNTVAGAVSDLPITLAGAADGDIVSLGVPSAALTGITGDYFGWASNGVIYVRFANNNLVTAQDPPSALFKVRVDKFQ